MKKGTSVWHGLLNVLLELIVNKCKCITLFKNVKQLFKNVNNKADSVCCEAEVQSFERLLTVTHIHVTGWMDGRMLGSEADPAISERRCSTFPIDPPIFLPSSPTRVPFPFIPSFTKPPSQIEIYSLGEHCKLHQCVWHRARPQKQFWHFWSPGGKNLGSSCVVNLFQNIPLSTLYRLGFGKPGHVSTSESACEGFTAV